MEKISLYDLLSILLPGAIFTLFIEFLFFQFNWHIDNYEVNEYFKLTIFLSSSIFFGSIINIFTRAMLNGFYKKISLYTPMYKIFKKIFTKDTILAKKYFDVKLVEIGNKLGDTNIEIDNLDDKTYHKYIEVLWDEIYFELESNNKIKVAKDFQSFYFFFRNFFTLGLLLLFVLIVLTIVWYNTKHVFAYLLGFDVIMMILSIISAKWNRKQMAKRLFWTYYSLHKNEN